MIDQETRPALTGLICLSLSLAVNGAAFVSFDRALLSNVLQAERIHKQALRQAEKDKLRFEFIEAPPKTRPEKPESPKKISSRDAVNQDAQESSLLAPGAPQIKEGPSDQLAQQRGDGIPSPAPAPREASPESSSSKSQPDRRVMPGGRDKEIVSPDRPNQSGGLPADRQEPVEPIRYGRDKITTQEMSKTPSFGAQFKGDISFEATGSGMGEYMKNLKEKIWLAWFPPIAFKYPSEFRGADAVIQFTLNREGKIKILRVADDGGNPLFAAYCLEAVQRVPDFGPLPEEILAILGREDLEISFTFHYR